MSEAGLIPIPKHRWFRFSLRSMLVLMTVVAVWLAWELKFVRDRRTIAEGLVLEGGGAFQTRRQTAAREYPYDEGWRVVNLAPVWRRWMGDQTYSHVYLPAVATDADLRRAMRLFPEAEEVKKLPRLN